MFPGCCGREFRYFVPMKKRLPVLALGLLCAGHAWALDGVAQKLADRYLGILQGNPTQQTALDRLWKIYSDAGEVEAFRKLSREQTGEHPVLAAALLQKAGLNAEAEEILQAAAEKGEAAAAQLLAARLISKGDAEGAARILEAAVNVLPTPELWIQLGMCRSRAGDGAGARDAWEQAVALSPKDLGLRRKLARACAEAGDREAAVAHLQVIAEHGVPSERFDAWQEISRHRSAAGQWAEAITAQESLLSLMGPGHWQMDAARRRLFELHRQNGSLAALEKDLLAASEAKPRDPQPALRLAEFYDFSGQSADRLKWLRKASELMPADTEILCKVAALELAAGRHAEAAVFYDRAIETRPGNADLVFLRAEVAALAGDEAGAEKRVEEFLSAHAGDEGASTRVQEFYRRLRLSAPLERRLESRIKAAPDDEANALELARFYLEENRFSDAAAVLGRFNMANRPHEKAAALALQFSRMLQQAHVDDHALSWARKAADLQPGNPDYALHLAEVLVSGGDTPAALKALDRACSEAKGLPREDLDRRLHLLVQGRAKGRPAGGVIGRDTLARLEILRTKARQPGSSEADWMRLARWLRWSGDPVSAAAALREAVKTREDSESLQDMLATALVEAGDTPGAIQQLQVMVERFPGKAVEYRRRAGHLEFDLGNAEDGLRTFAALAEKRVGEWQAIVDLALAEQAAGNWFKALETWQRVYGMAPPEARPGIRQPLLNAAARLQLYERALDFLDSAAVEEKDSAAREDLLREAAAYAVQNQVTTAWRDRIDRHLAEAPDERQWEMANVFLLESEGRRDEARTALVESQRNLQESAPVLTSLLKAAEKSEDWEEAARLSRRLLALSRQPDATLSVQLARYLELAGRREEATGAWTAVASLHGRDPGALTEAAEFFDRTGNEAKMEFCYRGAAKFGNCAPQVLLRLGGLALERGDRFQALEDYSAVLSRVRPDPAAREILPLPELLANERPKPAPTVATPSGWRRPGGQPVPWGRPSEAENEGCRLLAIRKAGQLLANSSEKEKWLEQFTLPIERVWALYASGDTDAAFDLLEKLPMEPSAHEVAGQMYAALLIEADNGKRLTQWASRDPSKMDGRWDMALAAMVRMLEAGWRPEGVDVFADAPAIKRWQFARVFAAKDRYGLACLLGEKVPEALPNIAGADVFPASGAWLELAQWKIALRDPDGAIVCLDRAIESSPPAISLGSPFQAAIRARWLLTPKDLRPDFEKTIRERLEKSGVPESASAAAALLAALRGDAAEANAGLAKLFAEMEVSGGGDWAAFIQQGGLQLEEWGLAPFARELYRKELSRDRAYSALRGQDFRAQTEALLVANQISWTRAESLPYFLNEWMARGAANIELLRLAESLKKNGLPDRSASVLAALEEREPRDEQVMAGLLAFVDDPRTRPVVAALIERRLSEPLAGPSQTVVLNAAARLATQWEQAGEYQRCLDLLEKMDAAGVANRALAMQRVRVFCALGRHREALEEVETQARPLPPSSAGLAFSLASLYAGFGRAGEARAVLEKEAAGASSSRSVPRQKIADTLPEAGKSELKLAALDKEGVSKVDRFRQGKEFLALNLDLPEAMRVAEMERLRREALRDSALLPEYFGLRKDLAAKLGQTSQLMQELEKEWDGGRGRSAAGETLLLLNLDAKNFGRVSSLLDEILNDAHFDEVFWDHYGQLLLLSGQPEQASRVLSALVSRAPGNPNRALFLAEALWKSGRQTEARELVYPIERIAALEVFRRSELARFELATGNIDGARKQLLAMHGRTTEAAALLWGRIAAASIAAGKPADASDSIGRALALPSSLSGAVLADYQAAKGDLATRKPGTSDFSLPPFLLRDFQIEAANRLASADNPSQAWLWIEAASRPLAVPAGRDLLRKLEGFDSERAAKLWEAGLDRDATWDMQCAAATFYLRRAQAAATPAARLTALQRAHQLHPGSFAIADTLANALLAEGKSTQARQVYRDVLDSFSDVADRREATKCLSAMPDTLPQPSALR
jgi:predicted Zn-dependent protease